MKRIYAIVHVTLSQMVIWGRMTENESALLANAEYNKRYKDRERHKHDYTVRLATSYGDLQPYVLVSFVPPLKIAPIFKCNIVKCPN
uniref:Uncharacterized protein n=1 Tax=Romanomermis culicivorax TaxID=13658 RepID=A0A915IZM4_ROMCU